MEATASGGNSRKKMAAMLEWTRQKSLEPVSITSTLVLPSYFKAPRYKWIVGWVVWWIFSTLLYFFIMMIIYKHWK